MEPMSWYKLMVPGGVCTRDKAPRDGAGGSVLHWEHPWVFWGYLRCSSAPGATEGLFEAMAVVVLLLLGTTSSSLLRC